MRHLVAFLGERTRDAIALLRFPPGVTLEDAGYDWDSLACGVQDPTLPPETVERLQALGVEIAATGPEAVSETLRRARVEGVRAGVAGFAEDYLDANERLGGERCVSIAEYAMHSAVGGEPLHAALRVHLLNAGGAIAHGDVAFRKSALPDIVRLRVAHLMAVETPRSSISIDIPCALHGRPCTVRSGTWALPHLDLLKGVRRSWLGFRVTLPWRHVDGVAAGRSNAPRAIAAIVLDALPDEAWSDDPPPRDFAFMVAVATARTCEEYAMLKSSLEKCASPREAVLRARDPAWVVSRTLESLGG